MSTDADRGAERSSELFGRTAFAAILRCAVTERLRLTTGLRVWSRMVLRSRCDTSRSVLIRSGQDAFCARQNESDPIQRTGIVDCGRNGRFLPCGKFAQCLAEDLPRACLGETGH